MRGGPPQQIGDLFTIGGILARAREIQGVTVVPSLSDVAAPPEPKTNSPEDVGFAAPAPGIETEPCKSCQAPIIFARRIDATGEVVFNPKTHKPVWMVVDPEPSPKGNIRCSKRGNGVVAYVLTAQDTLPIDGKLRLSHHATCPNAKQHRRSR